MQQEVLFDKALVIMPRVRFLIILMLGVVLQLPAHAQTITWTPRGDLNAALPESIRVFEGVDAMLPLKAWYISATPTAGGAWAVQALLSDAAGGTETVSSFAAGSEALVAINGGYFGGGQSFSLVASSGQVLVHNIAALNRSGQTFYPTRGAFGMLEGGQLDVAWVYNVDGAAYAYPAPSPNAQGNPQPQPSTNFPAGGSPWPVVDGIGGGPVLVENGQTNITWEEEVFFGSGIGEVSTRNPRTAIGYTASGTLLMLVVDGRQGGSAGASLTEMAQIMRDLGAVEALNLDGGGSSTLVVNQTLVNRPEGGTLQRSVATALVLAPPPAPPDPNEALFFDTGDACCYRETGDWFESANTPFHGSTPARLNAVGSGNDRAVFALDALPAGIYDVAAWWVPADNRATNTPYTVYQRGVGTTVRVNQRDPATLNQWNRLGTFDLASGDSVVVTDDAIGGVFAAFVSVDALRLMPVTTTDTAPVPSFAHKPGLVVYPNPTNDRVSLRYVGQQPGRVVGAVYDVVGRAVVRFEQPVAPGEQQFTVDLARLPVGLYLVRLVSPDGIIQQPVVRR